MGTGGVNNFHDGFAILLGSDHLLFSVMQSFRMQGYETHNYSNVFKYAVN